LNKAKYFNLICVFKSLENTKVDFDPTMITFSNSNDHIHLLHSYKDEEIKEGNHLIDFIKKTYELNKKEFNFQLFDNYQDYLDNATGQSEMVKKMNNEFPGNLLGTDFYVRDGSTVYTSKKRNKELEDLINSL
jgi:hypothetical protein